MLSVAAGTTFYTLLAIFPAMAALVSLYGLVADAATINDHLAMLQGVLPSGALDILGEQVKRITAKGNTTLGLTFFTSLAISLWSANAGVKAMFDALNIVYEEEEKRSFVQLNLRSLAFTLGALLFVVTALTGIVVLPVVLNFIGYFGISISPSAWYIALLRWPILLAILLFGLALLYRYGPTATCRAGAGSPRAASSPGGVARRLDRVLLVRLQLRQLQRDLRLARRGDRLHDLDLDLLDDRADRRRDQRRDRAPDRARHHGRARDAARHPPRPDGRYRGGAGLTRRPLRAVRSSTTVSGAARRRRLIMSYGPTWNSMFCFPVFWPFRRVR